MIDPTKARSLVAVLALSASAFVGIALTKAVAIGLALTGEMTKGTP